MPKHDLFPLWYDLEEVVTVETRDQPGVIKFEDNPFPRLVFRHVVLHGAVSAASPLAQR